MIIISTTEGGKSKNKTQLPIQIHKWRFAQNYTQTAFCFFFQGLQGLWHWTKVIGWCSPAPAFLEHTLHVFLVLNIISTSCLSVAWGGASWMGASCVAVTVTSSWVTASMKSWNSDQSHFAFTASWCLATTHALCTHTSSMWIKTLLHQFHEFQQEIFHHLITQINTSHVFLVVSQAGTDMHITLLTTDLSAPCSYGCRVIKVGQHTHCLFVWSVSKCQTVTLGEFEVKVPLVFGMTFTRKSFLFTRTVP